MEAKSTDEKINEMYKVLVGEPELRRKGVLERLEDLEDDKQKRVARHAKLIGIASGISITAGYGLSKLIEFWDRLTHQHQ